MLEASAPVLVYKGCTTESESMQVQGMKAGAGDNSSILQAPLLVLAASLSW